MKKTICKFVCESVTKFPHERKQVKLSARYDATLPDDQAFNKATPSGSFEAYIDNPAIEGFFDPGKEYYLEIRPVEIANECA